jgi:hypothetical protein
MDLHQIADLAQVIGGLALLVSVVFLFFEVRTNNRLTRAANTQALVGLASPFQLGLVQDRNMAELFVHGGEKYAELDEVDRSRYRSLLTWWLILHENIYYQWRRGLLDHRSFKPWANDLKRFVKQQNLRAHWPEMQGLFQDQFVRYMRALLAEEEGALDVADFPRSLRVPFTKALAEEPRGPLNA